MAPCRFQHVFQLSHFDLGERDCGPALLAPGVRHGMEGVGGDQAFELLFIGGEFEVRPAAIGGESDIDAGNLERRAIEMAFFAGLTQQQIAQQLCEPLGTIKARIRRGMLKLRQILAARL